MVKILHTQKVTCHMCIQKMCSKPTASWRNLASCCCTSQVSSWPGPSYPQNKSCSLFPAAFYFKKSSEKRNKLCASVKLFEEGKLLPATLFLGSRREPFMLGQGVSVPSEELRGGCSYRSSLSILNSPPTLFPEEGSWGQPIRHDKLNWHYGNSQQIINYTSLAY